MNKIGKMSRDEKQHYFSAISIHSYHAPSVELPQNGDRDVFPFMQKLEITNTTDREIWVSTRQGITYAVLPTASAVRSREPGITIRLQTTADKYNVRIDVRNKLNDPQNDDQRNLLSSISGQKHNTPSRLIHGLEYFLSVRELNDSDGIVYLSNCDLQISNHRDSRLPEHPFSLPGIDYHVITDNDFLNSKNVLGFSLRIVDNGNVVGGRYINLGNTIFYIKPEPDVSLQSGLYAVLNGSSESGYRSANPKATFYPIEEMDKQFGGLFKTFDEAKFNGDINRKLEQERAERDRDFKLREFELKNEELELRNQKHEYQVKLQELELRLNEAKQAAEFRKLDYTRETDYLGYREKVSDYERKMHSTRFTDTIEERSQKRKEMAEFTKVALQITAQVILGIALPLIIKSSKN